ncbi:uncharacterized protein LOC117033875 isoform X2 [Rhinolophus ferrumequinum]|uniref:uncharacterized protein LOC117033875 isoform X2 n=1 Tax=Rhinolophus ferrumequinum TaxID=59479 RepID=UPI00140F70BB|nr:uncharacterized protein LOC117033875 isoform X2 [Rhinolophus ferrumequinum]
MDGAGHRTSFTFSQGGLQPPHRSSLCGSPQPRAALQDTGAVNEEAWVPADPRPIWLPLSPGSCLQARMAFLCTDSGEARRPRLEVKAYPQGLPKFLTVPGKRTHPSEQQRIISCGRRVAAPATPAQALRSVPGHRRQHEDTPSFQHFPVAHPPHHPLPLPPGPPHRRPQPSRGAGRALKSLCGTACTVQGRTGSLPKAQACRQTRRFSWGGRSLGGQPGWRPRSHTLICTAGHPCAALQRLRHRPPADCPAPLHQARGSGPAPATGAEPQALQARGNPAVGPTSAAGPLPACRPIAGIPKLRGLARPQDTRRQSHEGCARVTDGAAGRALA